jgi:hypothetical protein
MRYPNQRPAITCVIAITRVIAGRGLKINPAV